MPFKNVNSLIDDKLRMRSDLLSRMTSSARRSLPQNLAAHCWVADFRNGTVFLVTDQAGLSNPIHYQQIEIIKRLNEEFRGEIDICLKKAEIRTSRFPIEI